jgi:hypothetical protein
MPLAQIREYVELVKGGPHTEERRLSLLLGHQRSLAAQIDQLRVCADWIGQKIRIYEQHRGEDVCGRPETAPGGTP